MHTRRHRMRRWSRGRSCTAAARRNWRTGSFRCCASRLPAAVRWAGPDDWLADGGRIDLGGQAVEVIATPGHTRGHIVLRTTDGALLFSGDHILPHITPSIGFERVPEPLPMRSFLAPLRRVRDQTLPRSTEDEWDLIEHAREGNADAFSLVYARYAGSSR